MINVQILQYSCFFVFGPVHRPGRGGRGQQGGPARDVLAAPQTPMAPAAGHAGRRLRAVARAVAPTPANGANLTRGADGRRRGGRGDDAAVGAVSETAAGTAGGGGDERGVDELARAVTAGVSEAAIAAARAGLEREALCVLHGFLPPPALAALRHEASSELFGRFRDAEAEGTWSPAYSAWIEDRPEYDTRPTHPRRREHLTRTNFVGYSEFPASSLFRQLYQSRELEALVSALLGVRMWQCVDSSRSLNLSVMQREGDTHGWHYVRSTGASFLAHLLQSLARVFAGRTRTPPSPRSSSRPRAPGASSSGRRSAETRATRTTPRCARSSTAAPRSCGATSSCPATSCSSGGAARPTGSLRWAGTAGGASWRCSPTPTSRTFTGGT